MTVTSSAASVRYLAIYIGGTVLLSLAAIYNGYPLVYWDSGSYLRALIEWHNLPDRPVFYSVLLGLLHWRWSLWPVVFGQSILTVFVIDRTLTGLVPRCSATVSLSVLAILTGATSLPWFTGQIMPYLFAPIVVLSLYLLCIDRYSMPRWQFWAIFCVLVAAEATHYSHIALAMGLIGLLCLVSLAFKWIPMRNLVPAILATVLAAVSIYAVNYVARKEIVFGPYNAILLLDRLLEYRTAQTFLARECPSVHYEICPYLDELNRLPPGFGAFMWNDAGVLQKLGGAEHYLPEAGRLTRDIILDAPLHHLWLTLEGGAALLVNFPTGAEFSSYGQDTQIYRMITKYFGRDVPEFLNSREQRGTLSFNLINAIDIPVGYVSLFAAVALLVMAIVRRDTRLSMFLMTVLTALPGNAYICGGLSSGDSHYQSRMMPLVTLAAMIGVLRFSRVRTQVIPGLPPPDGAVSQAG